MDITVEDIPGREAEFTLDENGFLLGTQQPKVMLATEDLSNTVKIKKEYYSEMEKRLKQVTKSPRVLIFNHATRISDSTYDINNFERDFKKGIHQAAVFAAHLDQSSWQADNVLLNIHPNEAETLLRVRIHDSQCMANNEASLQAPVWRLRRLDCPHDRPRHPSQQSVQDINVSMGVIYNPSHRWRYQVLLFKQADDYGKARACPHTAFLDQEFEGEAPRESIEIRALLIWPDFKPDLSTKI